MGSSGVGELLSRDIDVVAEAVEEEARLRRKELRRGHRAYRLVAEAPVREQSSQRSGCKVVDEKEQERATPAAREHVRGQTDTS